MRWRLLIPPVVVGLLIVGSFVLGIYGAQRLAIPVDRPDARLHVAPEMLVAGQHRALLDVWAQHREATYQRYYVAFSAPEEAVLVLSRHGFDEVEQVPLGVTDPGTSTSRATVSVIARGDGKKNTTLQAELYHLPPSTRPGLEPLDTRTVYVSIN